jgi:acyl-CoA synthetase (AMP-forming)/AMP-acid ligase II
MIYTSRFPNVNIPSHLSLPEFIFSRVDEHPNKPYMIDSVDGSIITFAQTRQLTKNVAHNLHQRFNFVKGDVCALLLPNVTLYPILFLGVAQAGGASSTINPLYTPEEVHKQLKAAGARYIIAMAENIENVLKAIENTLVDNIFLIGTFSKTNDIVRHVNDLLQAPLNDISQNIKIDPTNELVSIPFSSGTTGLNKGCMITHYNIISNCCQIESFGQVTKDSVIVGFLPYFHIYGNIIIMNLSLYVGATLVNVTKFDFENFLQLIGKYKITHANVVPPVMILLSKHPFIEKADLSSLKRLFCGAAPLSSEVTEQVKKRVNGVDIVQAYGMTELATAVTVTPSYQGKNGSAGVLLPNVEMKVVDCNDGKTLLGYNQEGELAFRTPSAMRGYLNNKQATDDTIKDGWLFTGDIGYIDEDGHVFIVDRLKELIKYKGFQVPPAELEGLLLKHDAVADCAVIGVPDQEAGEIPKAYIVKKKGYENITAKDIMDFVSKHVNPQKRVRLIEFTHEIPKTATGKILRRFLRSKL